MRRVPLLILSVCALAILTTPGVGQDKDKDKPKAKEDAGKDLPGPFHPYNVTGLFGEQPDPKEKGKELKGNYHCPVSDTNLDPGVLVFVKDVKFEPALLELLQKLDAAIDKNPGVRLRVTAVFYSDTLREVVGTTDKDDDTREKLAADLRTKATDLKLKHVVLALDGSGDPDLKGYLRDNADVTLYGFRKFHIEFEHALTRAQLVDKIKAIMDDVADKLGAKRQ